MKHSSHLAKTIQINFDDFFRSLNNIQRLRQRHEECGRIPLAGPLVPSGARVMQGPGGPSNQHEESEGAALAIARTRRANGAPFPSPSPAIRVSVGITMCTLWLTAQPTPNPHRGTAGVSAAARLCAAAEHEPDLDLDREGAEDGGSESEAGPSSVVDLSLLPLSTLMRYVRHYSLSVPPECSKALLVTAVEEHFCGTVVDEVCTPPALIPAAPSPPPRA